MADTVLNEMMKAALEIGEVEWGSTAEHTAVGHRRHVAKSVRTTAEIFQQHGSQKMHGVYIKDLETVVCHTRTSPNSGTHARILTALWNDFVRQAREAQERDAG